MISCTISGRVEGWPRYCKKTDICIMLHSKELAAEALRCGSHSFHTANTPYLPLPVGFHQVALPVVIPAIWLQLTTHLSTPRGWKAELAYLAGLQRTVYPYKWLQVWYKPVKVRQLPDVLPLSYTAKRTLVRIYCTCPKLLIFYDVNA